MTCGPGCYECAELDSAERVREREGVEVSVSVEAALHAADVGRRVPRVAGWSGDAAPLVAVAECVDVKLGD